MLCSRDPWNLQSMAKHGGKQIIKAKVRKQQKRKRSANAKRRRNNRKRGAYALGPRRNKAFENGFNDAFRQPKVPKLLPLTAAAKLSNRMLNEACVAGITRAAWTIDPLSAQVIPGFKDYVANGYGAPRAHSIAAQSRPGITALTLWCPNSEVSVGNLHMVIFPGNIKGAYWWAGQPVDNTYVSDNTKMEFFGRYQYEDEAPCWPIQGAIKVGDTLPVLVAAFDSTGKYYCMPQKNHFGTVTPCYFTVTNAAGNNTFKYSVLLGKPVSAGTGNDVRLEFLDSTGITLGYFNMNVPQGAAEVHASTVNFTYVATGYAVWMRIVPVVWDNNQVLIKWGAVQTTTFAAANKLAMTVAFGTGGVGCIGSNSKSNAEQTGTWWLLGNNPAYDALSRSDQMNPMVQNGVNALGTNTGPVKDRGGLLTCGFVPDPRAGFSTADKIMELANVDRNDALRGFNIIGAPRTNARYTVAMAGGAGDDGCYCVRINSGSASNLFTVLITGSLSFATAQRVHLPREVYPNDLAFQAYMVVMRNYWNKVSCNPNHLNTFVHFIKTFAHGIPGALESLGGALRTGAEVAGVAAAGASLFL